MNERGQIAGQDNGRLFFWSDGILSLGPGMVGGAVLGINNKGMVVGTETEAYPFIWENGDRTYPLGTEEGAAVAVNERGMVALWKLSGNSYLWDRGTLTDLGPGVVSDLNARGQVVGWFGRYPDNEGLVAHAFLWERGLITDLTPDFDVPWVTSSGGQWEAYRPPIRMNNRGQIVGPGGRRLDGTLIPAFLWEHGSLLVNLGSLGGNETLPKDINEQGQVVGWSKTAAGETHAFFWERGVMTDLGKTGERSEAFGINERGQVIAGSGFGPSGAFLWEKGVRTDIVNLGQASYGGIRLAINNHGQVMGTAEFLRPFLWERGTLTYLSGQVVAPGPGTLIGPPSADEITGMIGTEGDAAPMAGLVPGDVRTLLGAPSPNPSTGAVEFAIRLDRDDAVSISLYDAAGRLVASRAPEHIAAGSHALRWDPGVQKSGLYFARMETKSGGAVIRRWAILR